MHRLAAISIIIIAIPWIPLSHSVLPVSPKKKRTALQYARQCEKHLGPLPKFTCSDALEIPITVDGKPISVTKGNTGKKMKRCDKPAAFGDRCQLGNRVGRYQGKRADGSPNPDVVFMTFCRDGGMGVIGHNKKSGATCFFSIEERVSPRGDVPGPNDPGYNQAWQTPKVVAKDGCINCHMADPFLHTPWIDQVRNPKKKDEPIVPLLASVDSPYFVVGEEFPQPPGRTAGSKIASIPKELEGNACVECHRPQCIPKFFNVDMDELEMPAPFDDIHKETDPALIADREKLRKWCKSLKIRYFAGFGDDDEEEGEREEADDELIEE